MYVNKHYAATVLNKMEFQLWKSISIKKYIFNLERQ